MATSTERFDDALRELSQALPDEFVLARARLQRELREAGDTEGATALGRRRRPNLAAWACNQLTHRHPEMIDDLVGATEEVAAAQRAALRGEDGERLRSRGQARQAVIEEAADLAVATLKGVAPEPAGHRDTILATLDAASLEADATAELRAGVLAKPMRAPAAFDLVEGLPSAPSPTPAKSRGRERAQAERDVENARADVTALAAAADELDAEQASAEMHANSTAVQCGEIEQALVRAQEAARAASEAARAARARVEQGKRQLRVASERLRQAEARRSELD
jgi:hypothetical protein